MVKRDPDTGQFQPETNGNVDEYMDNEVVHWATDWMPSSANQERSTFDQTYGGNGESGYNLVEIDRPDDMLVEILGFQFAVGDPSLAPDAEGDANLEMWVYDGEVTTTQANWHARTGENGEALLTQFTHGAGRGAGPATIEQWFPKPFLSTGNMTIHQNSDVNADGEIGVTVYYSYVDVDDDTLVKELLQQPQR